MPANPIVSVVDDDAALRAALKGLLRSVGLQVEVFASAEEFLATGRVVRGWRNVEKGSGSGGSR